MVIVGGGDVGCGSVYLILYVCSMVGMRAQCVFALRLCCGVCVVYAVVYAGVRSVYDGWANERIYT